MNIGNDDGILPLVAALRVQKDPTGNVVRHNVTLVVHGKLQPDGINYKKYYAAVARIALFRFLLSITMSKVWPIQ